MRARLVVTLSATLAAGAAVLAQKPGHLNPLVDLFAAKQAVFGVATPAPAAAKDALAHPESDYLFNGSMERGLDASRNGGPTPYESLKAVQDALLEAGSIVTKPSIRLKAPIAVKTPKVAPDPAKAAENVGRQLNAGVTTIIMVGVESPEEVKQVIAAMRFKSKGGTRPDAVENAPKYWGLDEKTYREKADVWPLNPNGELLLWVIVESKPGLEHVGEIAAVKGITGLFPGAGTLRGVFTPQNPDGSRGTFDAEGWEGANQKVLAACKANKLACGYPIAANDVESRYKQGFDLGVIQSFSEQGFQTLALARKVSGRDK